MEPRAGQHIAIVEPGAPRWLGGNLARNEIPGHA
jgi:hypothetical protein